MNTPVLLVIMDGFGLANPSAGNAISLADTPYLEYLLSGKDYPVRAIEASGEDVGLPAGQMGNSEVGHLNMGSGRIIYQDLSKINNAINDGSFFTNSVFAQLFEQIEAADGAALHLLGLLSDGGVHSDFEHLKALIKYASKHGVKYIVVHPFLDGRDVSPTSGIGYVQCLQEYIAQVQQEFDNVIEIGTLGGRYYAMDRDNRWERVKRAWDTIVVPNPQQHHVESLSPVEAVQRSYDDGVTDEFVEPMAFSSRGVQDGDGVAFFNFRPDRAREITRAFTQSDFSGFDRGRAPKVNYVCMTQYDETFDLPIAFPKAVPPMVLADKIAQLGLRQLHIAETEKYAHVTFFFNGGIEEPKPDEQRVLISSPKVATYDMQPEMSAYEVTDALTQAMCEGAADFYIVNYANCDMVGHTGVIPAAIKAVEAVDQCLQRLISLLIELKGVAIVTADHGNVEKMLAEDGSPHTAHTTASVPIVAIDASDDGRTIGFKDGDGRLADVAPTLFDLAQIEDIPKEWTGRSLLV